MRLSVSLALLAAAVPVAMALDASSLVQFVHEDFEREDFEFLEVDGGLSNLTEIGDPVLLTVHPSFGADLPVRFHKGLRLHVLMRSVSSRLGLEVDFANFTKQGRELDPASTATEFGLSDGDVVDVTSPGLVQMAAEANLEAARMERRAGIMEMYDEQERKLQEIRLEKRRKVALRVARMQAEQDRKHVLELKDEITLKFTNPIGGQDVSMAVKKVNWLEPTLELVAKRMGLNRTTVVFVFKDDDGVPSAIDPHDSVRTLGLYDEEPISVKCPKACRQSLAAAGPHEE